jgi:prevent-host-death family protein
MSATQSINIQAAKTHLSRLVEEVIAGADIVLAKAGKPLVRLVPFKPTKAARVGGQLAGQVWQAPDCWDTDEEVFADTPLVAPHKPGTTSVNYHDELKADRAHRRASKLAESPPRKR